MARQSKRIVKKYGKVIPNSLYVREGAGLTFEPIKDIPIIYQDEKIEIIGNIIKDINK